MTQISENPMDYVIRQLTTSATETTQPSPMRSRLRAAFTDPRPTHTPHPPGNTHIQAAIPAHQLQIQSTAEDTIDNHRTRNDRVNASPDDDTKMEDQLAQLNQDPEKEQIDPIVAQKNNSLPS